MLRPRENSATVILLLILFIFIFFISQAALQKREEPPFPVPQGGDLAVVGGSTAALIAALEAAGAGAQVFIFPMGKKFLRILHILFQKVWLPAPHLFRRSRM